MVRWPLDSGSTIGEAAVSDKVGSDGDGRYLDTCIMCMGDGCASCGQTGIVVMEDGRKIGYPSDQGIVRTDLS